MQHSIARDCRGDIGLSAFVTFRENFKCIFPYLQVFPNGTENAKLLSFQYVGYMLRSWSLSERMERDEWSRKAQPRSELLKISPRTHLFPGKKKFAYLQYKKFSFYNTKSFLSTSIEGFLDARNVFIL